MPPLKYAFIVCMLREYCDYCGYIFQSLFRDSRYLDTEAVSIVFEVTMMILGFMHGVPRKPSQCGNVVLHNGRSLIPCFLLSFRMVCYDVSGYIKTYYCSLM